MREQKIESKIFSDVLYSQLYVEHSIENIIETKVTEVFAWNLQRVNINALTGRNLIH